MSSESLIYSFLDLFHSQRATTSILWDQMLWERKGSLQQLPTQVRKPGIYSLDFSLLSGRNHRLSSLALSCAAMEERSCWQSQVVPLTCSNASKCICCCFGVLFVSCLAFFFSAIGVMKLLVLKPLPIGDHPSQCFAVSPGPQPGCARTGLQSSVGSTIGTEFCYLVPRWVTSHRFLGIWCWIPQLPQKHFCSWMNA